MAKAVVQSSIVFEVLEKDNYEDWSETIRAYLEFKDLWDVVESDEQPSDRDADEAIKILEFRAWNKKNSEALHAIKISCGRHFLSKIRGIREANKAWRTLQANFNPPLPKRMEYTINPQQGDEENVDDEYKKAYKSLADALSRRDISDAIELSKKNPALLKERLPDYRPLLHQLIMLVSSYFFYLDEVVEMLKLDHFPKEALEMRDSSGRTPLAVAIDSLWVSSSIIELYSITPSSVWALEDSKYGATVLSKCFESFEYGLVPKLLREHPHLIFAKDVNGLSPLYVAARAPYIVYTGRGYNRKFPKFISNFLRPWLPYTLDSVDFEITGIELLIAMRNAIKSLNMTSGLRDAFFEAIKCGNFNFIVMLINADKKILEEVNDMSRNIYMCAIEYRQPRVFSLIFWDKKQWKDHRTLYEIEWQDKWKNNLLHMAATWTPPNALDPISKLPAVLMISEEMWYGEVRKLVPHLKRKSNADRKTPYELFKENHKDLMMEAEKWMKESASSWAIVGPLVITIMFAAAFQIPGGYNQEKGFPIFLNKKLFKLYMVLVSISFFSATISVLKFLEILSSNYQFKDFLSSLRTYNVITGTLFLSLATMLIAFCLGLFLTLHGELAIFLPIALIATFLVGYIAYTKFPLFVETFTTYKRRNSPFERNIGDEVESIFQMLNGQSTEEVAT